jgi:hypothetical protein
MSARRWVALAALVATAPGCAFMVDTTYWLGSKRYHESIEERAPTTESRTAVEYDVSVEPDGRLRLACTERTRGIERTWNVYKTWQRRGGYDAPTYLGISILDGVFGGTTAGVLGGLCAKKDGISCWNLLWASPWAIDLAWSLYRYGTAGPAKLVNKEKGGESLALARAPASQTPVSCEGISLVLGTATGQSEEAALTSGEGEPRRMNDGGVALFADPDGAVSLAGTPAAIEAWARSAYLSLWAVDGNGVAHEVTVDRCSALRPYTARLQGNTLAAYQRDCPPPPMPGQQ